MAALVICYSEAKFVYLYRKEARVKNQESRLKKFLLYPPLLIIEGLSFE